MSDRLSRLGILATILTIVPLASAQKHPWPSDLIPQVCTQLVSSQSKPPPMPPQLEAIFKDLEAHKSFRIPPDQKDPPLPTPKDVMAGQQDLPAREKIDQAHLECFQDDCFPSAKKCKVCHEDHYREWSVSPHAYAMLSPVFVAMTNRINQLTSGTMGDFCIRCHTPVGMSMNEPINMSSMDRHPTSREGVTCVVCHRINQEWGKGAGRQALVSGGIHSPIFGPVGNQTLQRIVSDPEKYGRLKTDPSDEGRGSDVHARIVPFFQLTRPGFCGACHDVFGPNGFRLEDAFSEYKASSSARKFGHSCQDCHMGSVPGVPAGYDCAPAAKLGNVYTPDRKRTNHMFVGPDYSIVHPGIFPHNPDAVKEEHPGFRQKGQPQGLATMREWLEFDHLAGWGTPEFERNLPDDFESYVPESWKNASRRFRARDILNKQFELLDEATGFRHHLLATGYRLGEIKVKSVNRRGIKFCVEVSNGITGHGVPTGFDADRLVFLRVTVRDNNGKLVFLSGDLDPNGDVRDSHSVYVHNGKLPIDRQLFSLQSRFLTRNLRGGEREQVLPVNLSMDPLPFNRPETRPFTVFGRPTDSRKHKQNIEVGGKRIAQYQVKRSQLTGCGPYHVTVHLVAGMVPVNLVHTISPAGFDYSLSAREVADAIVAGHQTLHERHATIRVR